MHCDEVLVHGYDIAKGLGTEASPPADLIRSVLDRLFPWAPDGDPCENLLRSNGRLPPSGHDRLADWRPAPLTDWDRSRRRREN